MMPQGKPADDLLIGRLFCRFGLIEEITEYGLIIFCLRAANEISLTTMPKDQKEFEPLGQ